MVLFRARCGRRGEVFVCILFRFIPSLNLPYLATSTPSRLTNAFSRTTMISSSHSRSTVNRFFVIRWFQPNWIPRSSYSPNPLYSFTHPSTTPSTYLGALSVIKYAEDDPEPPFIPRHNFFRRYTFEYKLRNVQVHYRSCILEWLADLRFVFYTLFLTPAHYFTHIIDPRQWTSPCRPTLP